MKKFNEFINEQHFWGSAASGILPICTTTKRIGLGLRANWVLEPHTWGNFGGAIGLAEDGSEEESLSPIDNANKEFIEETGYKGKYETISSYIFEKGDFKYYNFIGLFDEEFDITEEGRFHAEVDEIKWFTIEEINELDNLHFGIQSLLDNALEQIKKYL
jgi:8-oxo-dGTP pyrophosphatase MutT (NUDIX family)